MNIKFEYEQFFDLVKKGKINEAFDYRATFTPEYLYKFYWLTDDSTDENNKKRFYSLRNNMIWFAKPEKQNDPFEFNGIYWEEERLLEAGVRQESIDRAKELLFHQISLAAFTSNMSNNLPMWAHYANNHQGYCVKYKVGNKRIFRNIIYGNQRKSLTNTFLHFLQQAHQGMTLDNEKFIKEAVVNSAVLQDKFFYKHISWSYENEYRAIYPFDGKTSGLNVPIKELKLSVEEIYCGINCSDTNKNELSQIASVLRVPCKECSISDTEFTVFLDT